jgi:serine protease
MRPQAFLLLAATAAASVVASKSVHADPFAQVPADLGALDAPTITVPADDTRDVVPGTIVVDVRDDATDADVAELSRAYGVALVPNSPWSAAHDRIELATVADADEASLLERIARDPRVEHAEPLAILRASFVPDDPLYAEKQWHLKRAGAERAWDYGCGRGVTVAIIDTGVACYDRGPFMRGSDLAGTRCAGGFDFVNDREDAADDHGHGTHVAGTVAQTTNNAKGTAGLAFCATLMPIKVLSKQGFGTTADVAEGIRFAADSGAQVINLSLGGPIRSGVLEAAVKHAHAKGVVIVAAAGNSGKSVGYPAAYPEVIAVSATDSADRIAWFSSRGPEIAIGAPGVGITQQTVCDGGRNKCEVFGTFNGTSMASPHVAGAAAMIIGLGVTDPDAVRDALLRTATPRGEATLYGAGVLDAGAASSRVFWGHLATRMVALFALFALVARRIRRRGGVVARTPGAIAGALVGAVGLVPLMPLLGPLVGRGGLRFAAELLARPLGEWDLYLGAGVHRWLPLASALPALALATLFFGARRLRPALGGFALGSAALVTEIAVSGDTAFAMGGAGRTAWTVASALVCVWLARIALDTKRSS